MIVVYVWPEPSCVKERERNQSVWLYLDNVLGKVPHRSLPLLLLDANGHTGFFQAQSSLWRKISSEAVGVSFPQRENYNGTQLRLLLEKHFMRAMNTDERFSCGPTYYGPPPLCVRTRVDCVCIAQAVQWQVRSVRVFHSMASQLQLMAAAGRRDHVPVGLEMDVALPFDCAPPISKNRWDKEQLAMLALQGRGRGRFLEEMQLELEGMVKGGVDSQPPLSAEENWQSLVKSYMLGGTAFSSCISQTYGTPFRYCLPLFKECLQLGRPWSVLQWTHYLYIG